MHVIQQNMLKTFPHSPYCQEYKTAKTEFMVIGSHQRVHGLLNNQINIKIVGKSIKRVNKAKSLGLLIDEHLSWTKHINEKSKTISSAIA